MRGRSYVSLPRKYLKDKRLELGYSVELTSRKLNISRFYYYQIENGNRGTKLTVDLMNNLCEVLEIEPLRFLELEKLYQIDFKDLNDIK